jgi:hypothetical protein
LFSALPLGPLAVWAAQRLAPRAALRRVLGGGIMLAFVGAGFAIAMPMTPGSQAFTSSARARPGKMLNSGLATIPPGDALFITPPNIWWLYTSDWRVFSERSTLATLSDLLEVAFAPDYMAVWTPRFEGAGPRARWSASAAICLRTARSPAMLFYSLTTADFRPWPRVSAPTTWSSAAVMITRCRSCMRMRLTESIR